MIGELKDTTIELEKKSEDKFEPKAFFTPSGMTINKVMILGTATEKEDVGKDDAFWRLRIVDPSGGMSAYAGTYQAECLQTIAHLEIPKFVCIVGKLSIYKTETNTITSIRPESIQVINDVSRATFIIDASALLLERLKAIKANPQKKAEIEAFYPEFNFNELELMAKESIKSLLIPTKEIPQEQGPVQEQAQEPVQEPIQEPVQEPVQEPPEVKTPGTAKKAKKPETKKEVPKKEEIKGIVVKDIKEVLVEIFSEKKKILATAIPAALKAKNIDPMKFNIDGAMKTLFDQGIIYEKNGMIYYAE